MCDISFSLKKSEGASSHIGHKQIKKILWMSKKKSYIFKKKMHEPVPGDGAYCISTKVCKSYHEDLRCIYDKVGSPSDNPNSNGRIGSGRCGNVEENNRCSLDCNKDLWPNSSKTQDERCDEWDKCKGCDELCA